MAKRVVMAGGSGFLGRAAEAHFAALGYDVVVLSRAPSKPNQLVWDGVNVGLWATALEGADGVLNFSGKSVNTRFTPDAVQEIIDSRVKSIETLAKAMNNCRVPPRAFVQSGGNFIYGNTGDAILDESAPVGKGFLTDVSVAWEKAFSDATLPRTRKTMFRMGVVLGKGGQLDVLVKLTRAFLGSAIGSGKQYMTWIHIADLCEMFVWGVERDTIAGMFNACSPNPVTNKDFMAAMRRTLNRPPVPPVPEFMARIGAGVLGSEPEMLLEGNRCVPKRFLEAGFKFQYGELDAALKQWLAS